MATGGWRMLRPGSGSGAVLTLDFTLAKVRAQAGFADLAPRLPDGYAVWGTDETAWPTAPGVPRAQLDEWLHSVRQLGDWLHSVRQADQPVRAVFGFCASASLAMALAHRLAAAGHERPAVVLFDPVQVGAGALRDLAEESVRRLSAMSMAGPGPAGGDPPGEGRASAGPPGADPPEDLGQLATALARRYAERAAAVGVAQSIPDSIVDQLSQRVETNLRFLTLCAAAWSCGRAGPDLLVLSGGHQVPPSLSGVAEFRVPVTSDELLSDPRAARAAAGVLAGAFADGRP